MFLIREAISTARLDAEIHIVSDGEKAIRFLDQADRDPEAPPLSLVVLDINLPKKPGREVLQFLRRSRRSANTPVVVVTSSDSERDRDEMRSLGVREYFRKPSEYDSFMKLGDLVKRVIDRTPDPPAESKGAAN